MSGGDAHGIRRELVEEAVELLESIEHSTIWAAATDEESRAFDWALCTLREGIDEDDTRRGEASRTTAGGGVWEDRLRKIRNASASRTSNDHSGREADNWEEDLSDETVDFLVELDERWESDE